MGRIPPPRIWLPLQLALGLLVVAPALAFNFSQDFNSVRLPRVTDQINPYPGWSVWVDGQVWYDLRFAPEGPDSSVCLMLSASTVNPGHTDAAVRLRYDLALADPEFLFAVEPEAVFQWDWWFRDNRLSEAVGLRLIFRQGEDTFTREHWNTPFYTPNQGFDPVLVWDCHRLDLDDLAEACNDPTQPCVELLAVEFELRGPVNQELRLDNIYFGPRDGVSDCGEVREPGFVIQKLQSYCATIADLDHDRRWDVLLPGFLGRPAQYWAGSDLLFADRAESLGLNRYLGDVGLFLDVDNDGDQDLVTARVEQDGLTVRENLGHGRWSDEPLTYPIRGIPASISSMAAADVDNDGDLDIYLSVLDQCDALMLGDGHGGFKSAPPGWSVMLEEVRVSNGVLWTDLDDDGDQDQIVAGVGVLRNDGAGRLHLTDPLLSPSRASMVEGATVADLDADGRLDVYLGIDQDSCRRPLSSRNILFWGAEGGALARDRRSNSMAADDGHCEGVAAADFNNDGLLDLFIGNRSGPSLCLLGEGGGGFRPDRGGVFGTLEVSDLYGLCALDRDDDGDQDVLLLRKHNDPVLLENPTDNLRFLKLRLLGVESNWDAIGATAVLRHDPSRPDGFQARRELRAGEGYQLSGPRELHFGLPDDGPFSLEVRFPGGTVVRREGLRPGQRLILVENDAFLARWWHILTRIHGPRWSARLADLPVPSQHLAMALLMVLTLLVWWPLLRQRRSGLVPVGVVMAVILLVAVRHHVLWQGTDAWGLAFSMPLGAAVGASLPLAVRYLRRPRSPVTIWDRLNEEFISYTHTGWCKNLETLIRQGIMLSGDLGPADRESLLVRWREALEQFDGAVAPKLATISELGMSLDETRAVSQDLAAGLRRCRRARRDHPDEVAAGARELRQTADRIAAMVEARLSCRLDQAARTAFRAIKPELDAAGVAATLDEDQAVGVSVRIREHELVMVLQDLLRNAAEAAAEGTTPAVSLAVEADIRRAVIAIADNGPGLGGRDPEQLCQAGYTTKDGGSGYGLYHARKTLGIYRGVLDLDEAPGGGLQVTISLLRPLHSRTEQPRTLT